MAQDLHRLALRRWPIESPATGDCLQVRIFLVVRKEKVGTIHPVPATLFPDESRLKPGCPLSHQSAARAMLIESRYRLLSARIRAVNVLPMARRNGVATSGASLASLSTASDEIFNNTLAG